jgi:hypothetical protein
MINRLSTVLALAFTVSACGSGSSKDPVPTPPSAGTGGSSTGGSGAGGTGGFGAGGSGEAGSGGTGGSATGGAGGGGGTATGGSGGGEGDAAPAGGSGGSAADSGTPTPPMSGDMIGWYEAEAVPPNQISGPATVGTCGAGPCASVAAIKEGMECCSGGKKVSQLIRGNGQLQFNAVKAPADGMYDVTWWFHCGKNDNFGDANCGGVPHTPSGCRPHVILVNGTKLPKIYEFPCFPGSWGQIHAATVAMPLKAGDNTIRIYATPGRDASDMDAIAVYPAGKGTPPIAGSH